MTDKNLSDFNDEIICGNLTYKDKRALIFHFLYLIDSYNYDVEWESLIEKFSQDFRINLSDNCDILEITKSIVSQRVEIDKKILPLLANWRFERIGTITKLILRIGVWDLENTDLDSAIVINECVELGKCFAEKDAFKFINGILDEFQKKFKTPV